MYYVRCGMCYASCGMCYISNIFLQALVQIRTPQDGGATHKMVVCKYYTHCFIRPIRWLVGQAEAEVIEGNATVMGGQTLDEMTKKERPGGGSMDHDDGTALTFIHVMHPALCEGQIPGGKGVFEAV